MSIISNPIYPPDILNIGKEFMTAFLIIVLTIGLIVSDTKCWNRLTSNFTEMCSTTLFVISIEIIIYGIVLRRLNIDPLSLMMSMTLIGLYAAFMGIRFK